MNIEEAEYPSNFDLNHFKSLKTYKERVTYCNDTLKKIGVGSSRIVYQIDNKTVLKLAKNSKGIEQNLTEADGTLNYWYGDIIAQVLESHPDDLWIESELAKKITPNRFKQLKGYTINDLFYYLNNTLKKPQYKLSPELTQLLNEDEFCKQVLDMCGTFDMEIGDFNRISTYGEIDSKGVVITDYGLTKSTYQDFYQRENVNEVIEENPDNIDNYKKPVKVVVNENKVILFEHIDKDTKKKTIITTKVDNKPNFGCLMLDLNIPNWNKLLDIIQPEDIYDEIGFGKETEAHCTVLYGFHLDNDNLVNELKEMTKQNCKEPIKLTVAGVSCFNNKDFDVLKFDIQSEKMSELNKICKQFPHTNTFPNYHPHITIAYLKPNLGEKYIKLFENVKNLSIFGNGFTYSSKKTNDGKNKDTWKI